MKTELKLMFDNNIKAGTKLKDLCVIKRNGWTAKVPLMELTFAGFITRQRNAEEVIRSGEHRVRFVEFYQNLFGRDTPF